MGALVVVDAGVVIALLDATDAHHAEATAALDERLDDDLRLPASAYAEALVRPSEAGLLRRAKSQIRLASLTVDSIGHDTAEAAAAIRARHRSLRLPDALVFGHAEAIGADVVLTTDHRWKRVSPRVEVV